MTLNKYIFIITLFLMYNTYNDGKLVKKIISLKKYYTIAFWGFLGLGVYIYINKFPNKSSNIFTHADKVMPYLPIDGETMEIINPILNVSKFMNVTEPMPYVPPSEKRMINSGYQNKGKRVVSETKKKYVAANQDWLCKKCNSKLPACFEVDHIQRLDQGGSNNVTNLVALCRTCHGEKTMMENL